ncbi:MAG TPA: aldo/keto reductase [Solirubrobacterales bacterium]|jgi:D-threo-aldose 1-dehydrogenase
MSSAEPSTSLDRRRIGDTEVHVTTLGLGGGALGGLYDVVTEEAAVETVRHAYESGIRYFDTAPLYGHGRSEERVGIGLDGISRDSYTLSCKVGVIIEPEPGRTPELEERYADAFLLDGHYDFSYDGAMRSLEGSLERLRTDHLDIVYIHDPDEADSALPSGERSGADHFGAVMDGIYRALHDLREQGVAKAIGVGLNGTEMLTRFARAGDFDVFLLAGRYTLLEQNGLDDLFPVCREKDISLVVGGVFNSGILATGITDPKATYNYKKADPEAIERVHRLDEVCARHGASLPGAALQFPLGDDVVAAVIPGMRSAQEVDRNVALIAEAISPGAWEELRGEGLVDPRAALPTRSRVEKQ